MTSRHSSGGLQKLTGVHPDLTALGKYLAGGMNIGAFGGRAKIMDAFDATQPGALVHSGTFNNNVLSMAGGVVALGEIFDSAAAEAHFQKGEKLRNRCRQFPSILNGSTILWFEKWRNEALNSVAFRELQANENLGHVPSRGVATAC
jgi:glutamate-1-semialdehyde aminotransferase